MTEARTYLNGEHFNKCLAVSYLSAISSPPLLTYLANRMVVHVFRRNQTALCCTEAGNGGGTDAEENRLRSIGRTRRSELLGKRDDNRMMADSKRHLFK